MATSAKSQTDEGVPASTNVRGAAYPRILPDGRVRFRAKAPGAQKVEFDLDKRYAATKDAEGLWTATSNPQVPGFHYYWLVLDGLQVNDPASESFYGVGKQSSGIEIPEAGADYSLPKEVPHGEIRERRYLSKTTGEWRRIFVYTPPGYDRDTTTRYPALYLQHGGGEDERGWPVQGRLAPIMDNLIAEGRARPMLVVMEQGYARRKGEPEVPLSPPRGGTGAMPPDFGRMFSAFGAVVVDDLIPMIDATYRTLPDRDHRAIAGLSMGGMQAFTIGLGHLDLFSSIGGFSGAGGGFGGGTFDPKTAHGGVMSDPEAFNRRVKLLWLGIGSREAKNMHDSVVGYREALTKASIKTVLYESPGTAHEWLTWRRDLREFAPLLFQEARPLSFGPVRLNPDDKPAFPSAPFGFDVRRDGIPRGRMEEVSYESKSVGTTRRMMVYTPPGFSSFKRYPVLYLLHGIGGTEREWQEHGAPEAILDNLSADGKIEPMIVVFPNSRAQKDDRPGKNIYADAPAFGEFDKDLFGSVIPFVEAHYPVKKDRTDRALAGLSMGGGQTLNFGLGHPETFAWLGAFSPAPNQRPPEELVADPAKLSGLRLLWLSCGDQDGLIALSQRLHAALKAKGVPHVWHVDSGPHDFSVWKNDFYLFSQRIFRP